MSSLRVQQQSRANARYQRLVNRETIQAATKRFKRWSPEEIAVALDLTLTAEQAALQLGRTLWAVKNVRKDRWRYDG